MKVYVFKSLPPFLWGYTRDIRALWTLEECQMPYETHGLACGPNGLEDEKGFETVSPFKQVPVIDDNGFILTESGAILLYLAEKSGKLMPSDLKGRAQVTRWTFTALNNVELLTLPITLIDMQGDSNPNAKALRPGIVDVLGRFLGAIDQRLEKRMYIADADFTVADIALTCVLREIRKTDILPKFANVDKYRFRCEERPAFEKVLNEYEDRLGIPPGSAR